MDTYTSPAAAPVVTGARRRAPGKTWSATSTVEWFGTGGESIARTADARTAPAAAVKGRVHYRENGRSRKPTFAGDQLTRQVTAFEALLAAAYLNDWPADQQGRPVPPAPLPATGTLGAATPTPAPPAGSSAGSGTDEQSPRVALGQLPGESGAPADALPATGAVDGGSDVVRLVRWYQGFVETTDKRRGGKRSRNTTGGYRSNLDFFLDWARYQGGDERLEALGLEAGAPWSAAPGSSPCPGRSAGPESFDRRAMALRALRSAASGAQSIDVSPVRSSRPAPTPVTARPDKPRRHGADVGKPP